MEFHVEPLGGASASGHFKLSFSSLSEKERHYLRMIEEIPALHCTRALEEFDYDPKDEETIYFGSREELEKFAFFLAIAKEVAEHFPAHSIRRVLDKQEDTSSSGSRLGLY